MVAGRLPSRAAKRASHGMEIHQNYLPFLCYIVIINLLEAFIGLLYL